MANKAEALKGEAPKADAPAAEAPTPAEAAPAASSGGIKAWLPLILAVVLMPALAWGITSFVIVPKVLKARETTGTTGGEEQSGEDNKHGAEEHEAASEGGKGDGHGKESPGKGKKKQNYQISKLIVNLAGSMGTRYLMTSTTLVGTKSGFKEIIEEHKDQLLDLTIGVLATKTINDLEKPGSRNQIRSELISVYNHALGAGLVEEIYFTEFAIQ
jgi:flagellar FliL protein